MFQEPFSYHVIGDIMIWSRDDHLSGRLVYMVNYTSNEPWHINICYTTVAFLRAMNISPYNTVLCLNPPLELHESV